MNNPCTSTTLTTSGVTITAMEVEVGLSVTSSSYSQIADSVATAQSSSAFCGARTYTITKSDGTSLSTWATVTGTTSFTITLAPNNDNLWSASAQTLKLHIVLASYTSISADISFQATIKQYKCTSSTTYTPSPSAMTTAYTYTIGATAHTITAPTFTTSPYTCGETVTYSLKKQDGTDAPSFVTFTASTREIRIYTSDTANSANVLLRVVVTRSEGTSPQNLDWTLSFTNPCSSGSIVTTGYTIDTVNVVVGGLYTSSLYPIVPDSAATTAGVATMCGARTYTI